MRVVACGRHAEGSREPMTASALQCVGSCPVACGDGRFKDWVVEKDKLNPEARDLSPKHQALSPKLQTPNPKPQTPNPEP